MSVYLWSLSARNTYIPTVAHLFLTEITRAYIMDAHCGSPDFSHVIELLPQPAGIAMLPFMYNIGKSNHHFSQKSWPLHHFLEKLPIKQYMYTNNIYAYAGKMVVKQLKTYKKDLFVNTFAMNGEGYILHFIVSTYSQKQ